MGAVTLIRAAARYPEIEALVADSPFASLEEEMDLRVPFPIMRSLIQFFAERETGVAQPWSTRWRISGRSVHDLCS